MCSLYVESSAPLVLDAGPNNSLDCMVQITRTCSSLSKEICAKPTWEFLMGASGQHVSMPACAKRAPSFARCVEETAVVTSLLMEKMSMENPPGIPSGLEPPRPLTKRKRDADGKTVFTRQLMIILSISENVAKKIVEHFGTLPSLQTALGDAKKFPKIRLDDKNTLGAARIKTLASYLL